MPYTYSERRNPELSIAHSVWRQQKSNLCRANIAFSLDMCCRFSNSVVEAGLEAAARDGAGDLHPEKASDLPDTCSVSDESMWRRYVSRFPSSSLSSASESESELVLPLVVPLASLPVSSLLLPL